MASEASLLGLDEIVIAGRNHDGQTVASGPKKQLEQFQEYLRSIDVNSVAVPSPTSFHHPRLRTAATAWIERLRGMAISGPSQTVYSPIGRRFIDRDDDVAATLTSQFLRPFDLQGGINDAIAAGATKFVDCGSTGSLARIISRAGPNGLEVDGAEVRVVRDAAETSPDDRQTDRSPSPVAHHRNQPKRGVDVRANRAHVPPIAIVGQGCLLPAGATSPEQLHAAITEQRNGLIDQRTVDPHWTDDFYSEQLVPDRSTTHLTGRVHDADVIAPSNVDPRVFEGFSRAQRLLCVALAPCIDSLREAERVVCLIGATADGFEDQDVVSSLRYAGIDPSDGEVDSRIQTAKSAFQEPYAAIQEVIDKVVRPGLELTLIDAACASSLYTVALGMQALEANRADAVIAGGVFCPGQGNSCLFSQFYGTTSTGCRPFDASADGVVFSEGAALVTIRRVADAEEHGIPIAAVIRGAGLSSDGKSTSANVPQTHGQLLSLQRCYDNYGIDPSSIQAIEAHGTSTPVGDTTELETLQQFFAGHTAGPIPVHSLKGLLGHAGWAAGTASLIAACQYLRSGTFPAQANHKEPSQKLVDVADTLTVQSQEASLPQRQHRIAIDGFGFGGANAHIVLDSYVRSEVKGNGAQTIAKNSSDAQEDELVFVAYHEIAPTVKTSDGLKFDRRSETLLGRHVLLPDLADDLDISQTLAIRLVDEVISQLPQCDEELRRQTGILLAQSGKTERGVEATMRVLAQRLRRDLDGCDEMIQALHDAAGRARPSGAYTLQCMMPNVSSGRAALQLNLNGPNFVVDADAKSLEAAFTHASSLLQSGDEGGTRVVVVAAIDANPYRPVRELSHRGKDEFAAAFGVTTRRFAKELGLEVVAEVQPLLREACELGEGEAGLTSGAKVRALLGALDTPEAGVANGDAPSSENGSTSADVDFPIHVPVWVEKQLPIQQLKLASPDSSAILAVVPADSEQVAEVMATLPGYSQRFMLAIVGSDAKDIAAEVNQPNVHAVDLDDEDPTSAVLDRFDDFGADIILTVESMKSWELSTTLETVGENNEVCELFFLIAKRHAAQLEQGSVQLWSLCLDGWNGVIHPATGAVTGFLKAIRREFSPARTGVISTRGLSLIEAFERLHVERTLSDDEEEVVYNKTVRMVRRLRPCSGNDRAPRLASLDSESVVVATGGAHGVTAVLMDALLRDYQCTVIAIGRSSLEEGPVDPNGAQAEREFLRTLCS